MNAVPRCVLPTRLSPAAITRFRTCERQFYLADVERLDRRNERSPLLAQANAIHAALERFFGLDPDDRVPPEPALEQAFRSVWRTHWKLNTFANADLEIDFGCRALAMLTAFPERFDTRVAPLAREQWVKTLLPNGIELCGKVDRVDPLEDGLDIVDYKTGKRRIDGDDLSRDAAAQVYTIAATATFGLPVYRVRHLYLATGEEIAWWPEPEDLASLGENLVKQTDAVWSSGFSASPGEQCRFCPVALRCPERGRVRLSELATSDPLPF